MTNIEKIKRILDAGHWVKATYEDSETLTITSYYEDRISLFGKDKILYVGSAFPISFSYDDCTIEVIQRIPTPYKPGDKVLVLSNPQDNNKTMQAMVGKVCEVKSTNCYHYSVCDEVKYAYWDFPAHCLAPVFDDEEISDTNRIISGKEAKIVIDGKEYTCVLK